MPVLSLHFEYEGRKFKAFDRRDVFFGELRREEQPRSRNRASESAAQRLLERFGALELAYSEEYSPAPGSDADYILPIGDDCDALANFVHHALPELRRAGFEIAIDAHFPYRIPAPETPLHAELSPSAEHEDWFSFELGIEIDGQRVSILPALLEVIRDCSDRAELEARLCRPGRPRSLNVAPNTFVVLPPERWQLLLQTLLELFRGETRSLERLTVPRFCAPSLVRLQERADVGITWHDPQGLLPVARQPSACSPARRTGEPDTAAAPVLGIRLRDYQEYGVRWLAELSAGGFAGILADDMGLGKTLQTIAHLAAEKHAGRAQLPSLLVVPTTLVGNWQKELARSACALEVVTLHGPGRHRERARAAAADIVLTSYPVLVRDLQNFGELEYHYVILDEAQTIKNPNSQSHQAVSSLRARHRLCLTGTPIENRLEELWALFDFLMPGFMGSRLAFRKHFEKPIMEAADQNRLAALRAKIAPFILRRTKAQVVRELPPKTELLRSVELRGAQRDLYESIRISAQKDVRKAIRKAGLAGAQIAVLDALMKLRQVCCDPRLLRVPAAAQVRESAKYTLFFELLTSALELGRRVLVFSQFTSMLTLLSQGLLERGIRQAKLTGASTRRHELVQAFERGDAEVFLISLKAGGTGLNLTSADTVIHYDPWWNAAAHAQATDRSHRIGQVKPVFVYNLVAAGTVEQRMLELQARKRALAAHLLAENSGATAGSASPAFSAADVEHLLAPLDHEPAR